MTIRNLRHKVECATPVESYMATYAAIWVLRGSPPWQARHGLTSSDYQQAFDQLTGQGYRLVRISGYGVRGTDYYAAIFEQSPSPGWQARHNVPAGTYQGVFDQWRYQGFRPTRVSGYSVNGLTRFAAIFENVGLTSDDLATIQNTVTGVMQKHNVLGASIAIAIYGRLVYAAGFGRLDDDGRHYDNDHRFYGEPQLRPGLVADTTQLVAQWESARHQDYHGAYP